MDKDYIEVKIPILDSVDEMKVVKTFTQEQLWFVCAIAKAFEKSEQQVKKQKEAINKIQMVVIDMQTELMKLQPYHSYVIDGNKVRNFTEDFEDILKEVSE